LGKDYRILLIWGILKEAPKDGNNTEILLKKGFPPIQVPNFKKKVEISLLMEEKPGKLPHLLKGLLPANFLKKPEKWPNNNQFPEKNPANFLVKTGGKTNLSQEK